MNASEVSFRPAGFAKRLLAFAIDFLLIAVYILFLVGIGVVTMRLTSELVVLASLWTMDLLAFLVLILPVILYFALQEGSQRQATRGKRWVGITVVNAQGAKAELATGFDTIRNQVFPMAVGTYMCNSNFVWSNLAMADHWGAAGPGLCRDIRLEYPSKQGTSCAL